MQCKNGPSCDRTFTRQCNLRDHEAICDVVRMPVAGETVWCPVTGCHTKGRKVVVFLHAKAIHKMGVREFDAGVKTKFAKIIYRNDNSLYAARLVSIVLILENSGNDFFSLL